MTETSSFSQERAAVSKDWTRGSITSNLLLLSWPMVVMEVLWAISQIVDMIWVGKLGSSSIAGVGIVNIFMMLVMSIDMGFTLGARAMIARHVGAGDLQRANNVAGQVIVLGAFWGILLAAIGVLFAEPILVLFRAEAKVIAEGTAYMRVIFAGWVLLEVLVQGLYAIQSSGDTVRPMITEIVIRVVHLTLCPFLVLGWWVFPSLGVIGAALSNVVSQTLGAVIILSLLLGGHTRLRLVLGDFRPVPGILWRILKIGIPALVMNLQKSLGDLVLMWIIVPFGTVPVAAHSLASRVEAFLYAFCLGLGGGAGVLVGQNLGAGQPKRAERSGWAAVGLAEAILVICSIAILLWAESIIGIFTTEPDLVKVAGIFLRIATASYLLAAFVYVLQFGIAGAGDTLPTMVVSIAMIWVVQLPLAFILPQVANLGVFGVRWAIVAGMLTGAILYVIYFMLGRWKVKKI
jgi:putative MATE family efflux protein